MDLNAILQMIGAQQGGGMGMPFAMPGMGQQPGGPSFIDGLMSPPMGGYGTLDMGRMPGSGGVRTPGGVSSFGGGGGYQYPNMGVEPGSGGLRSPGGMNPPALGIPGAPSWTGGGLPASGLPNYIGGEAVGGTPGLGGGVSIHYPQMPPGGMPDFSNAQPMPMPTPGGGYNTNLPGRGNEGRFPPGGGYLPAPMPNPIVGNPGMGRPPGRGLPGVEPGTGGMRPPMGGYRPPMGGNSGIGSGGMRPPMMPGNPGIGSGGMRPPMMPGNSGVGGPAPMPTPGVPRPRPPMGGRPGIGSGGMRPPMMPGNSGREFRG